MLALAPRATTRDKDSLRVSNRAFAAQATDLFTSLPNQCEKGHNPPAAHPFTKSC